MTVPQDTGRRSLSDRADALLAVGHGVDEPFGSKMWADAAYELIRDQAFAIRQAAQSLHDAQMEVTHGATASAGFIDRCVNDAHNALTRSDRDR